LKYQYNRYMFNFIDIYSFILVGGCVDMGPSALVCPEAYNAVKTALTQLSSILPQGIMCNQDIGPERTKIPFLEGDSRKLIRGCSENRRKGVMYYFQKKINMYAVISHTIPFII